MNGQDSFVRCSHRFGDYKRNAVKTFVGFR